MYIQKDGTIGKLTEEVQNIPTGAKGFKVSSDGLLQASNAIIYGTIYASAGIIGGFNIATTLDDSSHAYSNTLYTQTTDSNGNTYQAGIKGNSTGNTSTEAAFYVRKKSSSASSWADSELPFYVRKNGQMYCEDLTIGNSLYLNRSSYNPKTDNYNVTKEKILSFEPTYNELTLGLNTSNAIYGVCIREDYTELTRKNSYLRFEDNLLYSLSANVALGTKDFQFTDLYVKRIFLNGTQLTIKNASGGGTSGEIGEDTKYTGGTGITVSNGKISMTGTIKRNDGSRYVDDPINGSFHITINHGWNFVDENNTEVTGSYYNGTTVIFSAHDKPALYRGKSIQIGDDSTQSIKMPVVYGTTGSGTKYVTIDANGTLGATSNGGSGGNDYVTSVSVSDNTVYYTKNGSTHNAGSISSSGSGTTYSAGTGITIYNGTISVTSGTYAAYDHIHRGINNSAGYGLWTNGQSGAKACVYGASNSSGGTSNATVNLGFQGGAFNAVHYTTLNKGSDRNIKECIAPYDDNIEKAYMEFKPVSYKYKTTNSIRIHDRIHYGFIAQDVESAIHKYGIDNEHAGFLQISKLNPDNEWGLDKLYSLAYDEFIALNTHMTQKAHHRIDSLESQLTDALSVIESLKKEIEMLKQAME